MGPTRHLFCPGRKRYGVGPPVHPWSPYDRFSEFYRLGCRVMAELGSAVSTLQVNPHWRSRGESQLRGDVEISPPGHKNARSEAAPSAQHGIRAVPADPATFFRRRSRRLIDRLGWNQLDTRDEFPKSRGIGRDGPYPVPRTQCGLRTRILMPRRRDLNTASQLRY